MDREESCGSIPAWTSACTRRIRVALALEISPATIPGSPNGIVGPDSTPWLPKSHRVVILRLMETQGLVLGPAVHLVVQGGLILAEAMRTAEHGSARKPRRELRLWIPSPIRSLSSGLHPCGMGTAHSRE